MYPIHARSVSHHSFIVVVGLAGSSIHSGSCIELPLADIWYALGLFYAI